MTLVYDAWRHYQETADRALSPGCTRASSASPTTCWRGAAATALLPVEGWGVPAVWIDNGFARPRHKQCAFNLFTAAVLRDGARAAGRAGGRRRRARRRLAGRWPGAARRRGAPLLERGARPLRRQPALGGRGGRARASTTARSPPRCCSTSARPARSPQSVAGAGGAAAGAGARLPGQRPLAHAGAGPPRPDRRRAAGAARALGDACPRCSRTTRRPRTGTCGATPRTSGATARSARCS